MSMPPSKRRKPSPAEISSAWAHAFSLVRDELIATGFEQLKAAEIAAYVAATLAKETEVGYQPRDN